MAGTANNSAWNNLTTSLGRGFEDGFWDRRYDDNLWNMWKEEFGSFPFVRHFINNGKLVYVNNRAYHSIFVEVAKIKAAQAIKERLAEALKPSKTENKSDSFQTTQKQFYTQLVQRGESVHSSYGEIPAKSGSSNKIVAQDKYGNKVKGALIMWYKSDKEIEEFVETYSSNSQVTENKDEEGTIKSKNITTTNSRSSTSFKTDKVFVIDLAPQIRVQSSKNIILTKVQGRDYTRKELVSGGDISFSVSGEIVSNHPDVYPTHEVQKFINIMQHSGIVSVNNLTFGQFKVKNIIIQNYQLDTPRNHNIQPYSFTCVAVEPSERVVVEDTIDSMVGWTSSYTSSESEKKQKWFDLILDNTLQRMAGSFVSTALDSLTYNI